MARPDYILVYITVPEQQKAAEIAYALVAAGLAAGANMVGSANSTYFWNGEIRQAEEWLIFCQSCRSKFNALKELVISLHPHQVPCIIATEIVAGHAPFLDWIHNSCED